MKNLTPEMKKELFPDNLILCGYRGSVAHNMYIPNTDPDSIDDIDLMGVYLAPLEYYVGLGLGKRYRKSIEKFVGKYDVVHYELRKFVNLLIKSNPNVLSLLWVKDNHYLKRTDYGNLLIENRDLFVSKLAYKSFTSYAYDQLKRMEHAATNGYMGEKRKQLVKRFGYDCKNAAHCIRLLKMGMEFLTTGELNVARSDAPMLLAIKKGEWGLGEVKGEAKRLFNLADEAYIRSTIPNEPDVKGIEKIVMDILLDYIYKNKNGGN
jgi:predicted nucleotidyltransferase